MGTGQRTGERTRAPLETEEAILDNRAAGELPEVVGAIRCVDGRILALDNDGVFGLRVRYERLVLTTGGGIVYVGDGDPVTVEG